MSRFERSLIIPADHPTLPGHFPGAPVVPGALLLQLILDACMEEGGRPTGFRQVKFLSPLLPDQRFRLTVDGDRFTLDRDHETIATGVVLFGATDR